MNPIVQTPRLRDNPFSAGRIRPGVMPFLHPRGESAASIVGRLRDGGWRGQIIAPHGCGKSSLLCSLIPAIELSGVRTALVALHDGQRRLPGGLQSIGHLSPPAVLIVNGYEQLRRWNRFWLNRFCRRRGIGLLATAHEDVGLPDLCRLRIDEEAAWRVVEQLQGGYVPLVSRKDLSERLRQRNGNLREALFDLYNLYQRRNPQG